MVKSLAFLIVLFLLLSSFMTGCKDRTLNEEANPKSLQENYVFKQLLYDNDYEFDSQHHMEGISHAGKKSYQLTAEKQYGTGFKVIAKDVNISANDELRISFWAFKEAMYNQLDYIGMLVISQERAGQNILWKSMDLAKILETKDLEILGNWVNFEYAQVLEDVQADDFFNIYIWNPNGEPLYYDDFSIELWQDPDSVASSIPSSYQEVTTVYSNNFDKVSQDYIVSQPTLSGEQAYQLSTVQQFGPTLKGRLADFNIKGGDYLQVSVAIYREEGYIGAASNSYVVMTLDSLTAQQSFIRQSIPLEPCLNSAKGQIRDSWQNLSYWIAIPENSNPQQILSIYLWRPSNALGNNLFIDNFEIKLWKKQTNN